MRLNYAKHATDSRKRIVKSACRWSLMTVALAAVAVVGPVHAIAALAIRRNTVPLRATSVRLVAEADGILMRTGWGSDVLALHEPTLRSCSENMFDEQSRTEPETVKTFYTLSLFETSTETFGWWSELAVPTFSPRGPLFVTAGDDGTLCMKSGTLRQANRWAKTLLDTLTGLMMLRQF